MLSRRHLNRTVKDLSSKWCWSEARSSWRLTPASSCPKNESQPEKNTYIYGPIHKSRGLKSLKNQGDVPKDFLKGYLFLSCGFYADVISIFNCVHLQKSLLLQNLVIITLKAKFFKHYYL